MKDQHRQLRRALTRGSDAERLDACWALRPVIPSSRARWGYFDLVASQVGSENNKLRWQSLIILGLFIEYKTRNRDIFHLVLDHCGKDEDMQQALATVILEHLLEYDFETMFPLVAHEVVNRGNRCLVDLLERCWAFGEAEAQWHQVEDLLARSNVP